MICIMLVKFLEIKWLKMYLFIILTALIRTCSCDLNNLYEYCSPNQKLCEIPSSYTLCPYSSSGLSEGCSNANEPLSANEKMYILSLHNKLRNRVATGNEKNQFGLLPTASNMLKLHWDVELESIPEKWAERCLNAVAAESYDDCKNKRGFNVTQNIGIIGSQGIVAEKRIFRIFHAWYSKSKSFNLNSIDNYFTSNEEDEAKEYTNLIWADTSAIGCSRVVLRNNTSDNQEDQGAVPWTFEKIICNYFPGGNIPGKSVYNKGSPCSDCPNGMKCSIEFPGLCSSNEIEMENNTMSLMQELTTNAAPDQDNKILETIKTETDETSKLLESDVRTFVSEPAETGMGMTAKYSTLTSQIPINEGSSIRTESPKLLVKTGIYINGKCHCPDISRFGQSVSKKLPSELTQKLKNQVPSTQGNSSKYEGVEDGKSVLKLKQGDRCYCMKSTSKGSSITIHSGFLYFVCIFHFIKFLDYED